MDRQTVLRTERLVVTTWAPQDADDLHRLHSDPETMRWVRHGRPETRQETEELLSTYLHEQAARGWTKWRVVDREGELAGRAGFGRSDAERELGYTLDRSRWGAGLATELAAGLVRWHRAHAGSEALVAWAAVENAASSRVLDKAGFTFVRFGAHNGLDCARYELGS